MNSRSGSLRIVKVDDTAPGIAEDRAAGSWTVGVALSGNAFGLSEAEATLLASADREARRTAAYRELEVAGPDAVIDSVADLPADLDAAPPPPNTREPPEPIGPARTR